MNRPTNSWK